METQEDKDMPSITPVKVVRTRGKSDTLRISRISRGRQTKYKWQFGFIPRHSGVERTTPHLALQAWLSKHRISIDEQSQKHVEHFLENEVFNPEETPAQTTGATLHRSTCQTPSTISSCRVVHPPADATIELEHAANPAPTTSGAGSDGQPGWMRHLDLVDTWNPTEILQERVRTQRWVPRPCHGEVRSLFREVANAWLKAQGSLCTVDAGRLAMLWLLLPNMILRMPPWFGTWHLRHQTRQRSPHEEQVSSLQTSRISHWELEIAAFALPGAEALVATFPAAQGPTRRWAHHTS